MKKKEKRYKIVSNCGPTNHNEENLDDFTEKDYEAFEDDTMKQNEKMHLLARAAELAGFEWWIEEIKD